MPTKETSEDYGYEDMSEEIERSAAQNHGRRFERRGAGLISEGTVSARIEALGKRAREEHQANELAAALETTTLEDERPKKRVRTTDTTNLSTMVERLDLNSSSDKNTDWSARVNNSSTSPER